MKKTAILLMLFCAIGVTRAQFKETTIIKPSIRESIIDTRSNFVLSLFDPSKFSMSHSYSLSYTAGGGNGLALGTYTNSMMYKFSDKLNLLVDASVVHSPYSSFGKEFQDQLSGFYLSRAQLSYRPTDNMFITLSYQNIPESYYYSNPFRRNYFGSDFFQGFPVTE